MSPLPHEYEKMVFSRFVMISRATVKGTLLIGLIQGAIGAVTLLVFGFRSWLVLGVVMIILSIVPMVGAWLVMIPVAIVEIATGSVWQGIIILLITVLIISSVDNLLRPRLVGREAHMHELIVFFSTVGGIGVFGVMGFIVGPVVAALFMAILDIWCREFRPQLESAENR